jgi:hypothetical protein
MNTPNNAKSPFVPFHAADHRIVTIKSKGKITLFDPIEKEEFKLPTKVKIAAKLAHLEAHNKRVVAARDRREHKRNKSFIDALTPVVSDPYDVLETIWLYDEPIDEFERQCVEIDRSEEDLFQIIVDEWEEDAALLAEDYYSIGDLQFYDDWDDDGFYNPITGKYQWY